MRWSQLCVSGGTLTVHVQLDRGGDRDGDVVIGRLAREDGVEVGAGEVGDLEVVDDLIKGDMLIRSIISAVLYFIGI